MADLVRLLAVIGRIPPSMWDAVVPMGPVQRALSPGSLVELNPQPIPPGREFLLSSAQAAHEIARAAILGEAFGREEASSSVGRAIEDWCGTPRPGWPYPWPFPWPAPTPPDPDPGPVMDVAASRVIGALTLASYASRLAEGPARDAIASGAEKLLDAGLG